MRPASVLGWVLAALLVWGTAASAQITAGGGRAQSAATATGNGTAIDTSRATTAAIQLSGTLTSLTVTFEATVNGSTWASKTCFPTGSTSGVTTATAVGVWRCDINGYSAIRVRVSTYVSGTVTADVALTSVPMSSWVGGN